MPDSNKDVPYLAAGLPARPCDFLLERRRRLVLTRLPQLPREELTLLDFGCGNGAQSMHLVDHCARLIGLDIDRGFLASFRAQLSADGRQHKVDPICYDGGPFPIASASVDCAVSFAVLEHVADEGLALRELARILKPGGRLIISVPNRWWIFETHGANLPLLPWNRVPFVSWWPTRLHDRFARARIYECSKIVSKIDALGLHVVESFYMTAPMDVLRWAPLQDLLRKTVFGPDQTALPSLATEVFVVAEKKPR